MNGTPERGSFSVSLFGFVLLNVAMLIDTMVFTTFLEFIQPSFAYSAFELILIMQG